MIAKIVMMVAMDVMASVRWCFAFEYNPNYSASHDTTTDAVTRTHTTTTQSTHL